jgi:glycosyltransferase involved in cell wall biosynthesis
MGTIVIDARDAAGPRLRGWGRYTRELVAALGSEVADELPLAVVTERGAAGLTGRMGPEFVYEQLWLPLALRRSRAALVHAPNCFLPLARSCPGVVTIHDLAFEEWPADFAPLTLRKYRLLTRLAARSAQRIICPSRFTADDVGRRYGIDPAKVRVIPEAPALAPGDGAGPGAAANPGAPANPAAAANPGAPANPAGPYILAVGDLRAKKNLGALVAAFARLRREAGIPHRLVLAGLDSGEGPRLAELAAGGPVRLTGYVDDHALDGLLRGADLVVHPSLHEGFGLVVLEAMARGTPVLAARATALPETGGAAAAYFDPRDPDDLGRQLQALLGDADRRATLARRGLDRARLFSWERTAAETAAVYRELL